MRGSTGPPYGVVQEVVFSRSPASGGGMKWTDIALPGALKSGIGPESPAIRNVTPQTGVVIMV